MYELTGIKPRHPLELQHLSSVPTAYAGYSLRPRFDISDMAVEPDT